MLCVRKCDTPLGPLRIAANERAVVRVLFPGDEIDAQERENALIRTAYDELMAFLEGKRKGFSVPVEPVGTEFQRRVWEALRAIPYGETRTYAQVAVQIGNPQAFRAVGLACNRNPVPFFIPCHRVIGTNGKLVGYRGGPEVKRWLVEREKENR